MIGVTPRGVLRSEAVAPSPPTRLSTFELKSSTRNVELESATVWGQMGHRLSRIYTRRDGGGKTSLGDGSRVPEKNHPRVEAFGTVDELNSVISYLLTYRLPTPIRHCLKEVQHALSTWADSLAYPGTPSCGHSRLPNSKSFLDRLNQDLEPLRGDDDPGLPLAVQYLNRLSDLLFVMARTLNRAEGRPDILWQRHRHG